MGFWSRLFGRTEFDSTVTGIEAFRELKTSAGPGDHIGILVDAVGRDEIAQGDVLES